MYSGIVEQRLHTYTALRRHSLGHMDAQCEEEGVGINMHACQPCCGSIEPDATAMNGPEAAGLSSSSDPPDVDDFHIFCRWSARQPNTDGDTESTRFLYWCWSHGLIGPRPVRVLKIAQHARPHGCPALLLIFGLCNDASITVASSRPSAQAEATLSVAKVLRFHQDCDGLAFAKLPAPKHIVCCF